MIAIVEKFAHHKTVIAAIIAMAKMFAKELRLNLNGSLESISQQLQVNRTYVYEVQKRLTEHLIPFVETQPGRPTSIPLRRETTTVVLENGRSRRDQLTIDVLRFRLEHEGAVVEHQNDNQHEERKVRNNYSDAFKYFVLNRYDQECEFMTQEEFAQAVEIPVDTLRTWLEQDRTPLLPENRPEKPKPVIPVDASEIVCHIARRFEKWEGSTRDFLSRMSKELGLKANQIKRVLCIVGMLSLPKRRTYRYRGSTEKLAPGTMLVTDGKTLNIDLTDSGEHLTLNWQAMIDQTTGTNTGFAITPNENAAGVAQALDASLAFMGGQLPEAVLCDNKSCYDDAELNDKIKPICDVIKATPGRPENKAIAEGTFSLFEERVGTICLDDSSKPALIQSAVSEIIRTYSATTNHVPRVEFEGKSRAQVLYDYVPDPKQQDKDRAFLRRLQKQHQKPFARTPQPDQRSRELLDSAFTQFGLLDKDRDGKLREFLSEFEPAAIKAAAAIFQTRQQRGKIKDQFAHRYLTKLIFNMQEEIDLQRLEEQLLDMGREQAQNWTKEQEQELEQLMRNHLSQKELCCHIAEKAAAGELPVIAAFWREKLRALLIDAKELIPTVSKHLHRLYWASLNTRILLINELAELEHGLQSR